jgi:hypothetical protein
MFPLKPLAVSWCDVQHAGGTDHHVAHAVIDDGIFAGVGYNRVENYAFSGRDRVGRDARECMARVPVGVNRGKYSADDVKRS